MSMGFRNWTLVCQGEEADNGPRYDAERRRTPKSVKIVLVSIVQQSYERPDETRLLFVTAAHGN